MCWNIYRTSYTSGMNNSFRMNGSAHSDKQRPSSFTFKNATPICSSIILILTSQYCLHRFALTMFCCVLTLFSVLFESLRILILCFTSEAQGHSTKRFSPPSLQFSNRGKESEIQLRIFTPLPCEISIINFQEPGIIFPLIYM